MKARVGDWIVIERGSTDRPARRGLVEEVRHGDGTPPYAVHWLDTGARTLVFPGPDAHVVSAEEVAAAHGRAG
ncbi:DUF1918 domain-containing protein [Actinosynnema sp. NPDC059797]